MLLFVVTLIPTLEQKAWHSSMNVPISESRKFYNRLGSKHRSPRRLLPSDKMPKYKSIYPFVHRKTADARSTLLYALHIPNPGTFDMLIHPGDYCDVYLTHDSMSVRKAHNAGRNHERNVLDYYQRTLHSTSSLHHLGRAQLYTNTTHCRNWP